MTHQEFLEHSKHDSAWFEISQADAWHLCNTDKRIQGTGFGCMLAIVKISVPVVVIGSAIGLYYSPLKWYYCILILLAITYIIESIHTKSIISLNSETKLKVLASIRDSEELFNELTNSGIINIIEK